MIIKLEDLTKDYKVKVKHGLLKNMFLPEYKIVSAVKNVSFSVDKGESVALLGPNGAGKTTIMKMLSGLLFPTSGKIDVLGYFPFDRKRDYLTRMGIVMGNRSGMAWDLTPSQNFELVQKIYKINPKELKVRLADFCEMLNVGKYLDTQVRKLSLGERMKMELIGSLLHSPEILYLDEPTIGLDIVSKQKIRTFLRDIQKSSGVTLLLTSHDMDDVERVSDRVIVINRGSLIYDNSMTELLRKYKTKKYLTLVLTEAVDSSVVKKYGKIIDKKPLSFTIQISSEKQAGIIAEMMEKLPVDDIDIVHIPLEEIIADMFEPQNPSN